MSTQQLPFYDRPTLEQIATEFLNEFHDKSKLMVDVEFILEAKMDYALLPFSSLNDFHGIEAALLPKKKIVYVDQYLLDHKERKCRFTVAEEIAHLLLHGSLYEDCKDINDAFAIYDSISAGDYYRLDRNAKYLAAAILMPTESFKQRAIEIYTDMDKKKFTSPAGLFYAIICRLVEDFNVGDFATEIRFKNLGLPRLLMP